MRRQINLRDPSDKLGNALGDLSSSVHKATAAGMGLEFIGRLLRGTHARCHSVPCKRWNSSRVSKNQPLSGNDVPRAGGIATFMRLPYQASAKGLDVCFFGVPLDSGTSNRSGTRFGPKQIRAESSLVRPTNGDTGAQPFNHLQVADIGDVPVTIYDLKRAVQDIKKFTQDVLDRDCLPLIMGGDHTITYPLLQAMKEKHGHVGLVHIDAHSDVNDTMMGSKLAHGTTFRRAVEDDLLDLNRVVQIGIRGSTYSLDESKWLAEKGFYVVRAQDCWHKSLTQLMEFVRKKMGDSPVYVTLDIDALDPAFAPGTGTPEIAGLTTFQMLEIIRGLKGLRIVGGDLVEVSPPYDLSGNTALTAANLLFELLCVLPSDTTSD